MDISVSQMMHMQKELFELHKDKWSPMEPEYGKDFILYMVEEIGETIAILKKKGSDAVLSDPDVRYSSSLPCDSGGNFGSLLKKTCPEHGPGLYT